MANALFAGSAVGIILLPIMIYHMLQLFLGAWLARRYARCADHAARKRDTSGQLARAHDEDE
jgi:solute carrier family 10 (sodium/bile acid cotransporter), member 7